MSRSELSPGGDLGSAYEQIRALYRESSPEHPELRRLSILLSSLWEAATVRERIEALAALVEWTRTDDDSLPPPPSSSDDPMLPAPGGRNRLAILVTVFSGSAELRRQFEACLAALLEDAHCVSLFADAGLPTDRGIFAEMSERVLRRVLPIPPEDEDLSRLLIRLFPSQQEADRFHSVPEELWEKTISALATSDANRVWGPVRNDMCDALRILAARVWALALSERLRVRLTSSVLVESPFFLLTRRRDTLLCTVSKPDAADAALAAWKEALLGCRRELESVTRRLESTGVHLDIVYSQDVIVKCLDRMEAIVAVLFAPSGAAKRAAVRSLLNDLVRARMSDRSMAALWSANLRLLAVKIVEHAGKTGEHYIARNRREYWSMWKAGVLGGVLTAFTAAVKMTVTHRGYPLFVEGFLAGLNYAASFILIQVWHLALATKQPSMTAAAFAGIIRSRKGSARLEELAAYIARICSTQLAAAIGNVAAVTVAASALALLWRWAGGATYLTAEESLHLFETLDPLASGTAAYAAFTGVILWFSSIVGGWIDNWATYRKLPQALAEHPLGLRWGKERFERLAKVLAPNVAAWGGSIVLGFMMGMTPPIGKFFGLPLDVRHVTLTTGTWALAGASLEMGVFHRHRFWRAIPGIAVIFVLNLTVSFTIALWVALRAYSIPAREHLSLLKTILARLFRHPGEFLLAPRTESAEQA